jgi:NhaA family Na+:H+ antiporter
MSEAGAPRLIERLTRPFERFMELEASSSLLLLAMTILALVWANSPWGDVYAHWLHLPLSVGAGGFRFELSLGHFVNDALMGIFFFVVGMEIKRELAIGELSTPSRALLPAFAALGGMVVPAGIYAALHWGEPTLRGWGIPMATDIAFAIAALSVFGSRVPSSLKVFLLALAIADDIGAVAVIAVFYTEELSTPWLLWAVAGLGFTAFLNFAGVRAYTVYFVVGGLVWFATHESGVHATIAGVALGLLTPATPVEDPPDRRSLVERSIGWIERLGDLIEGDEDADGHERSEIARRMARITRSTLSPIDELTHALHLWVAFVIMPVFALCNAGVTLEAETFTDPAATLVGVGVGLGLVLGKPIGITLFTWLAVRAGWVRLPHGVGWAHVIAVGCLAGIGFTVALFVASLAFTEAAPMAGAKLGILLGSLAATVIGVALLARALPGSAPTGAVEGV